MPDATKRPVWQRRVLKLMEERNACEMEAEDAERYLRRQRGASFAEVWSRTRKEEWMSWLLAELELLPAHTEGGDCWCFDESLRFYRELCSAATVERALRKAVPRA